MDKIIVSGEDKESKPIPISQSILPAFVASELIFSGKWGDLSPKACKLGMVWLSLLGNELWTDPYGMTDLSKLTDEEVKQAEAELSAANFLLLASPSNYQSSIIKADKPPYIGTDFMPVSFPSELVFNQYWANLSPEACKLFVVVVALGKGQVKNLDLLNLSKMPVETINKSMFELKDKGAIMARVEIPKPYHRPVNPKEWTV